MLETVKGGESPSTQTFEPKGGIRSQRREKVIKMQDQRLQRLQMGIEIFEHELGLKRSSLKRATKKALKVLPRTVVNEVITHLILQGKIPKDTQRADVYLDEVEEEAVKVA